MTHAELCNLTAHRFGKRAMITLVEYQSYVTFEFPDVLVFDGATALYEIKVSRSDFLADAKKDCRMKWTPKVSCYSYRYNARIFRHEEKYMIGIKAERPELYYIQAPHMGYKRYYVCEAGLIKADEIKNGFGLYWVRGARFYRQKESEKFRRNIHEEIKILSHAFRRYACEKNTNIIFGEYMIPPDKRRSADED